ncbi:MAG: ATP-binding protein [Planctomycetota bacterium]
MKELVVISGKGGTGKTSVVASFAALAESKVIADCDVDAADLHLVLAPNIKHREEFSASKQAMIDQERCTACGKCEEVCQFDAIHLDEPKTGVLGKTYRVDPIACEGCSVCVRFCPADAILFGDVVSGEWFISDTRHGPMVHAKLGVAAENSGKLVTLVRNKAREIAAENTLGLIIADGSPGIGCPVIASIAGASLVLVVTEPTLSGLHDLERVCGLTKFFGAQTAVCINKCDLNPEVAAEIENGAEEKGIRVLGRVRYDSAVTRAQVDGISVVEADGESAAADDIRALWQNVSAELNSER